MALTVARHHGDRRADRDPEDTVETVLHVLREHELPGVPVVNAGGRCVGIITEADLVLTDEDADLHLPHYFELFGGVVFLEPLRHFEERAAQGDRRARARPDDRGPGDDRADRDRARRPRG